MRAAKSEIPICISAFTIFFVFFMPASVRYTFSPCQPHFKKVAFGDHMFKGGLLVISSYGPYKSKTIAPT